MNTEKTTTTILQQMDEMYNSFQTETGQEPQYADCVVRYNDDGNTIETTIKLDCGVEEDEDDEIFFYCNGLEDLKGLTNEGPGTDFTVVEIIRFH
jgi:hypothetical protein